MNTQGIMAEGGASGQVKLQSARGEALVDYIATAGKRAYPADVIDLAKFALTDCIGVAIGAVNEPAVAATRTAALSWRAKGNARIFLGPTTTPALAGLVNGTMAHALDFDDSHPDGGGHPSAVCATAALAVADDRGAGPEEILSAFITGFEIMVRLGGGGKPGVGRTLQRKGLHPTCVFGRVGAAAVTAVMRGLPRQQIPNALGVAATTASGFVASFGTDSKPFHAGKAAMDGILAVDLAASGFTAAHGLFELEGGLLDALIQDHEVNPPTLDLDDSWWLRNDGFKPYACCRSTHPAVDAARALSSRLDGRTVERVEARVHTNALFTAGKLRPMTPLEGKFSVPFCIALGLHGYSLTPGDFSDETLNDPALKDLTSRVNATAVPEMDNIEAEIDLHLSDGTVLAERTECFLGHRNNPMTWKAQQTKFMGLVVPQLGREQAESLFARLRSFEQPGELERIREILAIQSSD